MLAAALILSAFPVSPWEREVVYQIFPRSFRDSNGDRIGDLRGIASELGFLHRLGVTTILLNPIAASPTYHNYFADDFMRIDPEFGTEGDLRRLTREAHARDMKVLLDMEPQYVTDRHSWYRAFLDDPAAPERNYLWTRGSWLWGRRLDWYDGSNARVAAVNPYHPVVRRHVRDAFLKWAGLGVDGFRIDHMMDDLDGKGIKTGLLTRFWRLILADVRRRHPRAFFVAEQADWGWGKDLFPKATVNAVYATVLWDAIKSMDREKLVRAIRGTAEATPPGATQFLFAENHDVDRLATAVAHDPAKTRLGMAIPFALKGTPTLYYGQELGMRGRKGPWSSDGADIPLRLAYEWRRRRDTAGTALWYRGTGPWWSDAFAKDDDGISVEEQAGRVGSMLEFTRRLIALRRKHPALREGTQRVLDVANPALLAVERRSGPRRVLFAANLSNAVLRIATKGGRDLWIDRPTGPVVEVPPFGFRFVELR